MPDKLERYFSKEPKPIEAIGFGIFMLSMLFGLLYLSMVYPVAMGLIATPALLYPVYKFIKAVWDA